MVVVPAAVGIRTTRIAAWSATVLFSFAAVACSDDRPHQPDESAAPLATEAASKPADSLAPESVAAGARSAVVGEDAKEWLARGLELGRRAMEAEVEDECELASNPYYDTLHALSQAIRAGGDAVLSELDGLSPAEFPFSASTEYEKWRRAVTPTWNDDALTPLLDEREWWPYRNDVFPPTWLETRGGGDIVEVSLEAEDDPILGRFRIETGGVVVKWRDGTEERLVPERRPFYFDEGRKWFDLLLLTGDPKAETPWGGERVQGPRAGDCPDTNF